MKGPLNIIVLGHVDAGKSTLLGHLMEYLEPSKFRTQSRVSRNMNETTSEKYAWALDGQAEERERGLTLDYHINHLNIGSRLVTFIDSPGHSELVANTLKGAMLADIALLVVDANDIKTKSQILQPQTIEHSKLARVLGITQFIVVINKMDKLKWDKNLYQQIMEEVQIFLTGPDIRANGNNITFVPISAREGTHLINLENRPKEASWWIQQSLLDILQDIKITPTQSVDTLVSIADGWLSLKGQSASAKVISGTLNVGDELLVSPYQSKAICHSIMVNKESVKTCEAGQYIDTIVLTNFNEELFSGCVLCNPLSPIPSSTTIKAMLMIFSISPPILPGQNLMLHLHTNFLPCYISKIIGQFDKKTGQLSPKKPPRFLTKNQTFSVEISFESKVCFTLKTSDKANHLSRIVLRRGNETVAGGFVCE